MSAPVLSGHQGADGADPAGPVVKPHPERIARELVILTFGGVGRMRRMAEWPFNPTPQPPHPPGTHAPASPTAPQPRGG